MTDLVYWNVWNGSVLRKYIYNEKFGGWEKHNSDGSVDWLFRSEPRKPDYAVDWFDKKNEALQASIDELNGENRKLILKIDKLLLQME